MRILRCDICKRDVDNLYLVKTCLLDENGQDSKIGLKQEVCRDCQDDIVAKIKMWMNGGIVSK